MGTDTSNDSGTAWADEPSSARHRSWVKWIVLGSVVLVVALLFVAPFAKKDRDEDDSRGPSTPAGQSTTSSSPAKTGRSAWPDEVTRRPEPFGRTKDLPPTAIGTAAPGVYVWSDFDGWHLWLAQGPDGVEVSGTVVSNAPIEKAVAENDAGVQVSTAGDTIDFTIGRSGQQVSGFNFNPGFYSSQLTVTIEGEQPIFLGRTTDPKRSPVELIKK